MCRLSSDEYNTSLIAHGARMRRSLVRDKEALRRTALHESGHVLTAMLTPAAHPVHKATIIPRGSALGWVSQVSPYLLPDVLAPG